jgi:hypothetical protein
VACVRRARSAPRPPASPGAGQAPVAHDDVPRAPGPRVGHLFIICFPITTSFSDETRIPGCRFESAERVITSNASRETYLSAYSECHVQHTSLHRRVHTPAWLTARLTRFALSRCDDEHPQAQRRVGVRLSDSAGRGVRRHRERPCWVGLLLHRARRNPGAWVGSGVAGVDGLNTGDAVTAEQMRALFGAGMHPLAAMRLEQLDDANLTDASVKAATQMGTPFKVYAGNSRRDVELGSDRLRRSCRA